MRVAEAVPMKSGIGGRFADAEMMIVLVTVCVSLFSVNDMKVIDVLFCVF